MHAIVVLVSCWGGGAQLLGGEFGKFQIISSGGCALIETAFHQRFDAFRNSFFALADIAKAFSEPSVAIKRIIEAT